MSDTAAPSDPDAEAARVLDALRPRRRARPRLAEPLHDARDGEVPTPFGPVMAWRLDPWGSPGTAAATLLVHGWEDDNALWGPLIGQLQDLGRPVVALDLPGHGFSPAEECSIGRAAAALRAVADALGPIDSLVAHSFGCPASVRAMADGLTVERAVLIATPMPSARLATRWIRVKEAMRLSDEMVERVQALAAERESIFPPFDYPALAGRMTARALLIHSLDDDDCEPENSRVIADAWGKQGGGRADLQWTEGLGHRLIAQDAATLMGVAAFIEHG